MEARLDGKTLTMYQVKHGGVLYMESLSAAVFQSSMTGQSALVKYRKGGCGSLAKPRHRFVQKRRP